MSKNRIEYIDVAKGLCMLLVVWQHTHTYYPSLETGEFWMESFRMPLFFLISGMFFKMYDSFGMFLKRKINTILIPFLFFYLVFSIAIPNILNYIGYEGLRESGTLGLKSFTNFIFEKTYSNSTVWFLLALFWLNLLFYGICSLNKGKNFFIVILLSVVCGLCGFFLGVNRIILWANLDNALTACPFFCFGWLLNKTDYKEYLNLKILISIIVLGFIFILLFSHGLSFKQNKWSIGDLFPLFGCGIIGSCAIIALSKLIENTKILQYYGENTLILLCMQMPVIQVINLIIRKCGMGLWLEFVTTFIVVMLSFFIIIPFMNRFLPWFVGKKKLI